MNRRVFVTTGAAAFALTATRIAAQADETTYQTELTGSVIALGDSGYTFGETGVEDDVESVEVIKGSSAGYVEFWPPIDDAEAFITSSIAEIQAQVPDAELVDSGVFDDGAWAVMHVVAGGMSLGLYREAQLGAYPEHDLVISIRAEVEGYEEAVAAFQEVTIDGMAPFLFLEDSDSIGLVAAITPVATTATRSSRTSRSSSENRTTTTTRSSRSSRSSSGENTTADDNSYRETVRAHRLEFQETMVIFAQALAILTDSTSARSATDKALTDIDGIAEEWILYPNRFAELTPPASESALVDLYEVWCDEIAALADTWNSARVGDATADDIFTQFNVVLDADDALGVELNESAMSRRRVAALGRSPLRLV